MNWIKLIIDFISFLQYLKDYQFLNKHIQFYNLEFEISYLWLVKEFCRIWDMMTVKSVIGESTNILWIYDVIQIFRSPQSLVLSWSRNLASLDLGPIKFWGGDDLWVAGCLVCFFVGEKFPNWQSGMIFLENVAQILAQVFVLERKGCL